MPLHNTGNVTLRTILCLLTSSLTFLMPGASAQNNAVPFISQPLSPMTVAPGGQPFTLNVNGAGFVSTSVVNWNGSPRSTTFISGTKLQASISAEDISGKNRQARKVAAERP